MKTRNSFSTVKSSITNRDGIEIYLRDVAKSELMTLAEEQELASRIKDGDQDAMNKMVLANTRFVITVAKNYTYTGLELADLIQQGNLGLLDAIHRFDPSIGVKFFSFAVHYIRLYINQYISENGSLVRVPVNHIANLGKIKRFINKYMAETGEYPNSDVISEGTGIDEDAVINAIAADKDSVSIETPVGHTDDNDCTIEGTIRADVAATDHIVNDESLNQDLKRMLKVLLSKRDMQIVSDLFGLEGREYSEDEVAMRYKLTVVRIQQIRRNALEKLQEHKDFLKSYLAA